MPLIDSEIKQLILDLLKNPGERDMQTLVGASQIGNPCDFCLGRALKGTEPKLFSKYWLGAKLGTALHRELEHEEIKHIETAERAEFKVLEGARIEQSIVLGTIEGYGEIRSKPDLVIVGEAHLVDHKSSTRKKVALYKKENRVPIQYIYQQHLYAWGLSKMGINIERISLVFVNRDGTGDDDIWVYSFNYDESMALQAWNRLIALWDFVGSGNDINKLKSNEDCYVCNVILNRW